MSFTLAIVGRPNVGKSTLFNRLVGKRLALVDDKPGVTRDRREGAGRLGDLAFTVVDTAGFDEGAPDSLISRMMEQTEAGDRGCRRDPVPDRCARRPDPDRPAVRRSGAPYRQARDRRRQQERVARRQRARSRPMRLALAIRSRSRPSTARACPISMTRSAPLCPSTRRSRSKTMSRDRRRARQPADPRRGRRPPQFRQVDADQPPARRRAPAHRPRSRHHARHDHGDARMARTRIPPLRHRGHAQARAHRGEAREALGRRHAERDPLRRSRRRADGCRAPVRGTGSAHRRSGGARGQGARDRHEQMGLDGGQIRRGRKAAPGGRSLAAAGEGRADRRGLGAAPAKGSTG